MPPEPLELLRRLVAFDSVSARSNLPLADFLANLLDGPGVVEARDAYRDGAGVDKANLLLRLGPAAEEESRAGLVLSGHMDVVPADEEGWTSDPFTVDERDGLLYGRGTADMKGFLALAAHAAARLDPAELVAPLVLVFTCDEELGTVGAEHLHDHFGDVAATIGPLPASAVIGEPTGLRVVRMHKGHLKVRLTVRGVSAHSGYPHLGDNAIEATGRVITALGELRRELEAEHPPHREHFPDVPHVTLNQGTVRGGSAINIVPDRCVLEVGARILPGMDSAELLERLRGRIGEALGETPHTLERLSDSPPMWLDESAPVHRALTELTREAGMAQGGSPSVSFATDAGWLSRLGPDCAVWGPGSIEVAHRPDEHLPRRELEVAAGVVDGLIRRFCLEPDREEG